MACFWIFPRTLRAPVTTIELYFSYTLNKRKLRFWMMMVNFQYDYNWLYHELKYNDPSIRIHFVPIQWTIQFSYLYNTLHDIIVVIFTSLASNWKNYGFYLCTFYFRFHCMKIRVCACVHVCYVYQFYFLAMMRRVNIST